MYTSLSITRAEEHKCARLKVKEGVRLALEAKRRSEVKEDNARLEAEEEVRLVEDSRMKYEKEEQARPRSDK